MREEELEGIRPEDVKNVVGPDTSDRELEAIAREIMGSKVEEESTEQIDLHDSEIAKIFEVQIGLNEKYKNRPNTFDNLMSFRNEAMQVYEKIGFEVEIDTMRASQLNEPPVITIVRRLTEFDPEKQQFDVRSGIADFFWDEYR